MILRGYERIKWGDEKDVPRWAKLSGINPDILRTRTENNEQTVEIEKNPQNHHPNPPKRKAVG